MKQGSLVSPYTSITIPVHVNADILAVQGHSPETSSIASSRVKIKIGQS